MRTISLLPKRKRSASILRAETFRNGTSGTDSKEYTMVPLGDVKKGQPFISLFPMMPEVKSSITEDMKKNGFDTSQPLIIWKEANLLIDGHTRLTAASDASLSKVAAIYKSFAEVDDALRYAYGLQFKRRNLTDADRFHFSETYLNNVGQQAKKSGWKKKELAAILSVSVGTAQKYISVISRASEKEKISVRSGEKSINTVYNSLLSREKAKTVSKRKNSTPSGKERPATNTECENETIEILMIPVQNIVAQLSYWAEKHRDFGVSNSPYRERILGVVDIIPEGNLLIPFAHELLGETAKKESE